MPFRFKRKESVTKAVRRLCCERIDDVMGMLDKGEHFDAVHDVRKEIKKLRAILRLARSGALFRTGCGVRLVGWHRLASSNKRPRESRRRSPSAIDRGQNGRLAAQDRLLDPIPGQPPADEGWR